MGPKEGIFLLKNHQNEQSGDKFNLGRNVIVHSVRFILQNPTISFIYESHEGGAVFSPVCRQPLSFLTK